MTVQVQSLMNFLMFQLTQQDKDSVLESEEQSLKINQDLIKLNEYNYIISVH